MDKSNNSIADMDGASALAALASAAAEADAKSGKTSDNSDTKSKIIANGGQVDKENKRDANWFDVGIIKGSSCTVSSYYLPSGMYIKMSLNLHVVVHFVFYNLHIFGQRKGIIFGFKIIYSCRNQDMMNTNIYLHSRLWKYLL